MTDNRDRGLEFGDLREQLLAEEYPLSHEALVEEYGDRELGHASGSSTLSEIVGPEGARSYENADEVRETVLNMVGSEAVGRKGYTDRSSNARGPEFEEESF